MSEETTNPDINALHYALRLASIKLCEACDEKPFNNGDARGNTYRWEDYREILAPALGVFLDETATIDPSTIGSLNAFAQEFRHQFLYLIHPDLIHELHDDDINEE